jgi:energy-coupling factor transport system ATP-binding protein
VIEFDGVGLTYPEASAPTLRNVDLVIEEGSLCLVAGRTGAGKTTLLQLVSGLVPHFTGGLLTGRVTVGGRDTRDHPPRELADVVGSVAQDPLHGFVTDSVEDELAYGMEQLGIEPAIMRRRVEETLDLLGIADLRDRSLRSLSGGQQQRVAIGSVLAAGPRVLILDEPTSALDPPAAEEVLAAILRLVHDLGLTVLLAEHRLERAVGYADRIVTVHGDGSVTDGSPGAELERLALVPPVVELGRMSGWSPLPLTVRDARAQAGSLRARLSLPEVAPPARGVIPARAASPLADTVALRAERLTVTYGLVAAVRDVTLELQCGSIAVLMGRNGAGKSSLLWALQGSGPRRSGIVRVAGVDPAVRRNGATPALVGLVPQTASDLLYHETVEEEWRQSDRDWQIQPGTTRDLMERIAGDTDPATHPRDLSEGRRLALVLAIQLAGSPQVVLLDEPTRGLDYPAKASLVTVLRGLAADGHAILVSTHDVELAASLADRVIVMASGEIVTDGTADDVLAASPAFAPQVAKILGAPWLTVDDVRRALAEPVAVETEIGGPA